MKSKPSKTAPIKDHLKHIDQVHSSIEAGIDS